MKANIVLYSNSIQMVCSAQYYGGLNLFWMIFGSYQDHSQDLAI